MQPDAQILLGAESICRMSDVLRAAHQVTNNSVTRNCRLQAIGDGCTMVNKPTALAAESGDQRASSQSAHTRQQLVVSESNDLNAPAAPAAAQAAAGAAGSKQPASPDSVNAGQPGKAPAQQQQAASPASTDPAATAAGASSADQQTASHPHSSPAPTTSAGGTEHQQQQGQQLQQQASKRQQQQAGQELEALEPLSPPDASEGPEALAEYAAYLQRWQAGDTLAQRWQRLKAKGLLAGLQTEWEDWQHDLLLDTIQLQLSTPGGLAAAAAAAAAGRQRRGRAEMEACTAAANGPAAAATGPGQEPRRVRTRRAPASFQDFHLEGRASGSPDRTDVHLSGAAAADVQRRMLAVQQQLHNGCHGPARAAGPHQQPQSNLPARQSNLGRQQLLPRGGAAQGPQQQQQPGAGILSEEFMQKFRVTVDMVRSSGNAAGMEGAAVLLANPAALHAFVSALSKHTDDPAAAMHRVAATLAAHATQQQQQQPPQPQPQPSQQ